MGVIDYKAANATLFALLYPGCDIADYEGHDPDYCGSWDALMPVLLERGIVVYTQSGPGVVIVGAGATDYWDRSFPLDGHPDHETAARYSAVVFLTDAIRRKA